MPVSEDPYAVEYVCRTLIFDVGSRGIQPIRRAASEVVYRRGTLPPFLANRRSGRM